MSHHKGFAASTVMLVVLGILMLGGVGYLVMKSQTSPVPAEKTTEADTETQTESGDSSEEGQKVNMDAQKNARVSIVWRFTDGGNVEMAEFTNVAVLINGVEYPVGKFGGNCAEVGASGGIDGKGLLTGELSAAQCWFAGGGDEIGIFAHEDGGVDIMVGDLSEGEEGAGMFRGDFKVKESIVF
jgi:hypothetical protein